MTISKSQIELDLAKDVVNRFFFSHISKKASEEAMGPLCSVYEVRIKDNLGMPPKLLSFRMVILNMEARTGWPTEMIV